MYILKLIDLSQQLNLVLENRICRSDSIERLFALIKQETTIPYTEVGNFQYGSCIHVTLKTFKKDGPLYQYGDLEFSINQDKKPIIFFPDCNEYINDFIIKRSIDCKMANFLYPENTIAAYSLNEEEINKIKECAEWEWNMIIDKIPDVSKLLT